MRFGACEGQTQQEERQSVRWEQAFWHRQQWKRGRGVRY